ncbi:MAG: tetratricopeptide repeat protein [Gemmatimonadota bacterium]|nr:MAG: tetratricopeptide repeat protein [Gemmatimonadota bacterium]
MAFDAIRHLTARRVPQILGIYLGASWILIEFVSFLVDRFALSPHLINLCLVVLGAMIPTVFLLAYFHGAPGPNEWATAEKIGIPVNLLAVAGLAALVFSDKPLGATTETLILETEEGETIERVVAKSEFRKRLITFNFQNETGDTELDWLQSAISLALLLDLEQDPFVDVTGYKGLQERLERSGFPNGVGMPLTLQTSIAEDSHSDYFVSGSFTVEADSLTVNASLYETQRQRLMAESSVSGAEAMEIVDRLSVQLRRDLEIPERHIEDLRDQRVADLLTESPEAFKLQMIAYNELMVKRDWISALEYLERAVQVDPTSAFAQYQLAFVYLLTGQKEKADSAALLAMQHLYRFPERWQYDFKYLYYEVIEPHPEKRFAVAKMKAELFPDDVDAHSLLASEYSNRHLRDKAIAEYENILRIDPSQYEYLRSIGYRYMEAGEFGKSRDYLQRYADAVPNNYAPFNALGDLYAEMGEHERARFYHERALIIASDNVQVMNDLATALYNLGELDESLEQHLAALDAARTVTERADAHWALSYHYHARGQLRKAVEHKELEWGLREDYLPANIVLAEIKLRSLELYANAGLADQALEIIRDAERRLEPPFNGFIPLAYLDLYLAMEDADRAEAALADARSWVERTGWGWFRADLLAGEGRIHELRGDYEEAIDSYREALKLTPTDVRLNRSIGRCLRQLGRLEEAEEQLLINLKRTPYNSRTHYQLARVYADMGDRARSQQHLAAASRVLENADPECEVAQEVRVMLAELEGSETST